MKDLSNKSIFEMSPQEFQEYLTPATLNLVNATLEKGLYYSYPAGNEFPGYFIHKFGDGTKKMISIDETTGIERIVMNL